MHFFVSNNARRRAIGDGKEAKAASCAIDRMRVYCVGA
jgi:hypothetical protein